MPIQTVELKNYPELKALIKRADPSYRKTKAFISVCDIVELTDTYYGGGTRAVYRAVNLLTGEVYSAPQYDPPQFGGPREAPRCNVPVDVVIIKTGSSCGKVATAHLYVNEANVPKLLPQSI